jgi:hypothetical protein
LTHEGPPALPVESLVDLGEIDGRTFDNGQKVTIPGYSGIVLADDGLQLRHGVKGRLCGESDFESGNGKAIAKCFGDKAKRLAW